MTLDEPEVWRQPLSNAHQSVVDTVAQEGDVYPLQRDGYHKVLPDQSMHDHPTSARLCKCSMAPLRSSLRDLTEEMVRARTKFPQPTFLVTALGEEIGELARELDDPSIACIVGPRFVNLIKHYGELQRHCLQRKTRDRIKAEALQVACVAMRIYEEADPVYSTVTDEAAQP